MEVLSTIINCLKYSANLEFFENWN